MRNNHNNIPYIITYILTIIFFLFGGLFFRQSFIALFIILIIVLPIISIFILKTVSSKISLEVIPKTASVQVGNSIKINLNIINKSIFPVLNSNVIFKLENLYYPQDNISTLSIAFVPKKSELLELSFDTAHTGMVEILFSKLEITDYLHLVTINIPLRMSVQVPVFPKKTGHKWNYTIPASFDSDEDDQYIAYGNPTHDLKETRQYQPGDSLKNIHWKLSSKTDSLTVKVFETSADRTILLLPELYNKDLDLVITNLYNFSLYLLKQKEYFKILVFSALDKSFETITIDTEDDLLRTILTLYHAPCYEMKSFALNSFFELNNKYIVYISSDSLSVNDQSGVVSMLTRKEDY